MFKGSDGIVVRVLIYAMVLTNVFFLFLFYPATAPHLPGFTAPADHRVDGANESGSINYAVNNRWGYQRVVFTEKCDGKLLTRVWLDRVEITDKTRSWVVSKNDVIVMAQGKYTHEELDWLTWQARFELVRHEPEQSATQGPGVIIPNPAFEASATQPAKPAIVQSRPAMGKEPKQPSPAEQ